MTYATLAAVRDALTQREPPEWTAKMLHPVPALPVVKDRAAYLIGKAKGEVVLDLGCSGPISAAIQPVARGYYGVDKAPGDWAVVDLDVSPEHLPQHMDVTLVLASELLEHLANPGWCLAALRAKYAPVPLLLTVPHAGAFQMRGDQEVVNRDHVAWYSYTTLKTLLERCGYGIEQARWYNGIPHRAEGLIVLARATAP